MYDTEEIGDEALILGIKNGEQDLYEVIVRRFNPYLYKIGRSYGYNHADTEDLMQDTFIDAYRGLDKFEGHAKFKTWITRIMLNNCYRKRNKMSRKNEFSREIREDAKPIFGSDVRSTQSVVRSHELRRIIEEAIERIPLDYRMVFGLRELNGMSVAETAELLNISESNVKVRFHRAKKLLREQIERTYSTVDLFEFNLVHCTPMVNKVMGKINADASDT